MEAKAKTADTNWLRPVAIPTRSMGLGAFLLSAMMLGVWIREWRAPFNTDLFWQIPEGIDILRGHFPTTVPYAISAGRWIDHEWLFEALAAWSWLHSVYPAFALLCLIAFVLAPLCLYVLLRRLQFSDVAAGWAAFLFAAGEQVGPAVRAQTFAYYPCALELFLLWRGLPRPWLLLPVAAIWANLHGSGAMASVLPLIFALGYASERNADAARRSLTGACFAFAGTLLTPNGVFFWAYSLAKMAPHNATIASIDEWRNVSFGDGVAWCVFVPVLLTLMLRGLAGQRVAGLLLSAVFFVLASQHIRHTPFFVLAASVTIAQGLHGTAILRWIESRRYAVSAIVLAPLVLGGIFASRNAFVASAEPAGPWRAAADIALHYRVTGNVYASYPWAAYLHFRRVPVRVLIDAHGDPFSADTWSDENAISTLQPGWLDILRRRHIDTVFVEDQSALAQRLKITPGWRVLAARDGVAALQTVR